MSFDVPILLIFFNRPETFGRVFEQVRRARPAKLYLAQDGARNDADREKIEECRKIAENIDWDCEVHRLYPEENRGCGRMPFSAISWILTAEEQAIILEDDCVPAETFFSYCKDMLEYFRADKRVAYISGLNHFGEWDCGDNSVFYAKTGAIWGWATWRDRWIQNDYFVSDIHDNYLQKLLTECIHNKTVAKDRIAGWERAARVKSTKENISFWDIQWGFVKYSQNLLVVIPKVNQITNIGVGAASTHAQNSRDTSWNKYKNFVFIPVKALDFPLKVPKYMICDEKYDNLVYKASEKSLLTRLKIKVKKIIGGLHNEN